MNTTPNRVPVIGMRTIKTVIAVCLSALFAKYVLKQMPFFACIGAVVAMERSISRSIKAIVIRNVGTVIGGVLGILVASLTQNIGIVSLGVVPLILLCTKIKRHESIVAGAIVYFAVVFLNNTAEAAWLYGLTRILGTFIGSVIGFAVNALIRRPADAQEEQDCEDIPFQPQLSDSQRDAAIEREWRSGDNLIRRILDRID